MTNPSPTLKPNQRVEFIRNYWSDLGTIPKGTTGIILGVETEQGQTEPTILVRVDQPLCFLEDGMMSFYPQCGPQANEDTGEEMNTVQQFEHYCRIV
jgi:hypothetical protein